MEQRATENSENNSILITQWRQAGAAQDIPDVHVLTLMLKHMEALRQKAAATGEAFARDC